MKPPSPLVDFLEYNMHVSPEYDNNVAINTILNFYLLTKRGKSMVYTNIHMHVSPEYGNKVAINLSICSLKGGEIMIYAYICMYPLNMANKYLSGFSICSLKWREYCI